MANTPKKSKDPTEVALSAIQDALEMRAPEPRGGFSAPRETARTGADDDLPRDGDLEGSARGKHSNLAFELQVLDGIG